MAHTNKISFYKNATAAQDRATARTNLVNALGDNDVVNGELVLSSYTENNTEKTIFGIKRTNGYTIFDPVDLKSVDLKATNSGLENNNGLGVVVDGTTIDFDGQGRLTATGGGGQPITYSGDGNSIDVTNQTISAIVKSQGGILVDSTTSDNHGLYVDTSKIQTKLTQGTNITISNGTISATDTTYTAGAGLSLSGTEFTIDTTVVATKVDLGSMSFTPGGNDVTTAINNLAGTVAGKQNTLVPSTNITIAADGKTISATDTTYSGDGNSIDVTNTVIRTKVKTNGGILIDSTTSNNHGLYVDTSKIQRKLSQGGGIEIDNSGTDTDHISVRVKSEDAQGSFANALECDMYGLYVDTTWDCGTY